MILCYTFLDFHKYYDYILLILPIFCIFEGIFVAKYLQRKKTGAIMLVFLFVVGTGYVLMEEYKVWRDYDSDYDAYCAKIKEIIQKPGVILADNLYWFCFPQGNLRDIIIPQTWLHMTQNMSSEQIFAYQNISYVILDPEISRELHNDSAIFDMPDGYIEVIESCQKKAEVYDFYYTRSFTSNHKTLVYECD